MSYALLFPGQGTQHAQMLPWLEAAPAAQPALRALTDAIGADWRRLLEDGRCRSNNALAQPLIVGTALAAWAVLRPLLPEHPEVVAGYSVGEVAAFAAAGVLGVEQAIALARQRAAWMDGAVAGRETGLVGIGSMTEAEVLGACHGLECAIRIDVDSNIYGGTSQSLASARETLADRAKFTDICVTLASHTSWMQDAAAGFADELRATPLHRPSCPIALNATGMTARDIPVLASALARQVGQCVEWRACMASVAERRPGCVLEIGGGQSLARMWRARYPDIPVRSLDEFHGPEGAAAWIEGHS
jgi:[acyl-carrier-protein] S-malonyltransferase